jgi:uncharacterized protein (TIGR02246 family)
MSQRTTTREIMVAGRSLAKRGGGRALLALLGLLGTLASCAATPEVPAHVLEIEARNRHLEEQFRAGNLLGVADVYADDGVLLDPNGTRNAGRDEIDAFWSAIESPVDWRISIKKIRGSDALAYEIGTSRLTTRRDGGLVTSACDFLWLWRRAPDGSWRIALDACWPR